MQNHHHRANEPLNVAAIAWRDGWAMLQIDLVLGTGDVEGVGMEFRAIVHVNPFGDAPRWPLRADSARHKSMRFVHHRMG